MELRIVEVAAAGGHSLVLAGNAQLRKKMVARVISRLLPTDTLENAKLASACGSMNILANPFRAIEFTPTVSTIAGTHGSFGEMAKANRGVLFIDKCETLPKSVQLAMKTVHEEKQITISSLRSKQTMPADFVLVLGFDACPAKGKYEYRNMVKETVGSNILYDNIDLQLWTRPDTEIEKNGELLDEFTLNDIRDAVEKVRELQRKRFAKEGISCNADMKPKHIDTYCKLSPETAEVAERIMTQCGFSMRSYRKILKIARTLADIDGNDSITSDNLAEAAGYRFLDVK